MSHSDERLKVCFIHPQYHPAFSGHAIQLDRVRQRLRGYDVRVEVWTPRLPGTPACEYRQGIRIRRFGPSGGSRPRRYLRMLNLAAGVALSGFRYDILHHAGINGETRWTILPAALLGRKQVIQMTLLGSDDPETLMRARPTRLSRVLYRRVDRWIALGTALLEAYRRTDLPRDRLVHIPVGVDLRRFRPAPDRGEVRKRLELPESGPIVLAVGDMVPRKGFDLLVEAAARVVVSVPETWFVVVGPKEHVDPDKHRVRVAYLEELETRARRLGVADRFRFVGAQRDMAAWYQAADVLAFPSRQEGLPNSVMEAAACGLPVVMAEMPGISCDLVDDGRTGYVVPQEDSRTLAERLVSVLSDEALRRAMGARGREWVEARFDLERVVEQYLALYRALAGAEAGGVASAPWFQEGV